MRYVVAVGNVQDMSYRPYSTLEEVLEDLKSAVGRVFIPAAGDDGYIHAERIDVLYWDEESGAHQVGHVISEFKEVTPTDCHECGNAFQVDADGIAQHLDVDDQVDYEADADHVPYALTEFGYVHTLVMERHAEQPEGRFVLDS